MSGVDKTKLDAIFNRLSQLFEITFPVAAGWRPNIYVSHSEADTNSNEYETLQIDYMMRALIASADIQLRPEMQRGVHIKELVGDDARVVDPQLPASVNAKAAELWVARRTGDESYFTSAVSEARTNLSSAVEALEGFTRTVAERLGRLGARTNEIAFTMLVPREQRQYEQMYARLMEMRAHLAHALRELDETISQADIDAHRQEIEQRALSRLVNKNATPPRIIHPDEAGVVLKMPTVTFGNRAAPAPEPLAVQPVIAPRKAPVAAHEPVTMPAPEATLRETMPTANVAIPPVYAAVELPETAPVMAEPIYQTAPSQPVAETVHTAPLAAEVESPFIESPFNEEHPAIAAKPEETESDSGDGFSYTGDFKPAAPRAGRPVQQGSSSMFPLHFLHSALQHKQQRNDKKSAN